MQSEDGFLLMDADAFARYLTSFSFARPVVRVQNHHTWIPNYAHFKGDNHFSLLRAMRRSHMEERGWSDIGQNLTTFPDGKVAVCRPLNTIPACIKGANTGGIGMEHVGNFDAGADTMTEAHKRIILQVNALLCRKLQLPVNTDSIVYHHWYDLNTGQRTNGTGVTKTCPGTNFFGGNSVEAAKAHFIPAVQQELGTLGTTEPAAVTPLASATVNADALNVRSRPSTSATVLRRLHRGDRVDIYARSSVYGSMEWTRINATQDEWVASPYLS